MAKNKGKKRKLTGKREKPAASAPVAPPKQGLSVDQALDFLEQATGKFVGTRADHNFLSGAMKMVRQIASDWVEGRKEIDALKDEIKSLKEQLSDQPLKLVENEDDEDDEDDDEDDEDDDEDDEEEDEDEENVQ